jgi:hypothetical protein
MRADFLDVLWTMLIFMAFVLWIWLAVTCFSDIFRRRDTSGFVKALWVIALIIAPYLGVLVYLVVNHGGIAERNEARVREVQQAFDERVREASGGGGAAAEIAEAQRLLQSGAITEDEFARLKAKALAD